MRRRLWLGIVAAIVLTAAGLAAAPGAPAPPLMKIKAVEFAYEPKELTSRPGEIIFHVENAGVLEHNFIVEDSAKKLIGKIAIIAPGDAEQVRLTLRNGVYTAYCDLPGHKDAGMVASIKVRE